MARYLFMRNLTQLLNHFHRREKRIKLQIEHVNMSQINLKVEIAYVGRRISSCVHSAKLGHISPTKAYVNRLAELQSRRAANSYLLDELYHELAGVRGNIRQLSESKRRGNK